MNSETIWRYNPLWGEWHLTKRLSSSLAGHVYKAERCSGSRTFYSAIKWIQIQGGVDSQKRLACCLEEAYRLYDLRNCSNVVLYEDHSVHERHDGTGYDLLIRMAYLTPIKVWMKERGITLGQVLQLGIALTVALEACIEKSILHRDVKLDNIFVDSEGVFKLGDFGIASDTRSTNNSKLRGGSKYYLAPEVQVGSFGNYQSDQYALGCVLIYLLEGKEAFFDKEILSASERYFKKIEGLKPLVEKCLAIRPTDRHASMSSLRASFQALLDKTPMSILQETLYPIEVYERPNIQAGVLNSPKAQIHIFLAHFSSGKTTLAVNLAYGLACKHRQKKVALIDLDFDKQAVFFHFPIQFEHLSKQQQILAYSRYRLLMDSIAHQRFDGNLKKGAYRFDNLDVFSSHSDIEMGARFETCLDFLSQAAAQYHFVVIDLPATCDSATLVYLKTTLKAKCHLIVTPDLEILHGVIRKAAGMKNCFENVDTLVVNKDVGMGREQYLSAMGTDRPAAEKIILVPEVYRGAIQAKYRGTMIYDAHEGYKMSLNQLMED